VRKVVPADAPAACVSPEGADFEQAASAIAAATKLMPRIRALITTSTSPLTKKNSLAAAPLRCNQSFF